MVVKSSQDVEVDGVYVDIGGLLVVVKGCIVCICDCVQCISVLGDVVDCVTEIEESGQLGDQAFAERGALQMCVNRRLSSPILMGLTSKGAAVSLSGGEALC